MAKLRKRGMRTAQGRPICSILSICFVVFVSPLSSCEKLVCKAMH